MIPYSSSILVTIKFASNIINKTNEIASCKQQNRIFRRLGDVQGFKQGDQKGLVRCQVYNGLSGRKSPKETVDRIQHMNSTVASLPVVDIKSNFSSPLIDDGVEIDDLLNQRETRICGCAVVFKGLLCHLLYPG